MYRYIYYKLYKIAKKTEKSWNPDMRMPANLAMVTISILQFFNLMVIFIFLVHWLKLIKPVSLSKEIIIVTGIIIYIINYFLFVRNKKFLLTEKKFDKELKKTKKIKTIFFWIYLVLSFALLFFMFAKFNTR